MSFSTAQGAWDAIAAQHSGQDKTQADYCAFSLNKDLSVVELGSGHAGAAAGGGRGAVVALLEANGDKLVFGAFKVTGVDNRESTISFRAKYVVFIHKGESCPPMLKSKAGTNNGNILEIFQGHTICIKSDGDLDDYAAEDIEKTLLAVGGAHKPKPARQL